MSTIQGNATSYFDLLTTLRSFLINTGHGWGLTYTGTGNGRLNSVIGTSSSVVETITCTATGSTTFTVSGSVTGALANATVGTAYTSAVCGFTIVAGGTPFIAGDVFTFNLSPKWTSLRWGGCGEPANRTISTVSTGTAVSLFDGVTNSGGITGGTLPFTATVQMQVAIEIKSFSITVQGTTLNPATFSLQHSPDGTTWTTAETWTGQTWTTSPETRLFVLAASAGSRLYWRLNVTAANGASLSLYEVAFYADASGKWAASHSFQFGLRGPGVDNAQQIHVVGTTAVNSGVGYWNIAFRGVRFWTDLELDIANITNICTAKSICLNNATIAYWIVAHGGRFILVTRLSGIYEIVYCGFGLPYETPTNHPYPMIIAAPSALGTRLYSDSAAASSSIYRNPPDPGDMGCEVIIPAGTWREIRNRTNGGSSEATTTAAYGKVWPYSFEETGRNEMIQIMRDAVDGSKFILPAVIDNVPDNHTWGEFDGLAYTSGYGNSAESLTRVGAIDWMAVSNIYRGSAWHFAAVALD